MIGSFYYQDLRDHLKIEKQQELAAIISLKIDQIIYWRQERIDFAGTLMNDPFIALRVRDFIKGRPNKALKAQLTERLASLVSYDYQSLALIDPEGTKHSRFEIAAHRRRHDRRIEIREARRRTAARVVVESRLVSPFEEASGPSSASTSGAMRFTSTNTGPYFARAHASAGSA